MSRTKLATAANVAAIMSTMALVVVAPVSMASEQAGAATDTLTFARIFVSSTPHLIAVTEDRDVELEAVDLTEALARTVSDPIDAYRTYGHDKLLQTVATAARITLAREQLVVPVNLADRHIAAGTNYPKHAGEAGVEDGPFLFAKLVAGSGPRATVNAGDGLLDYEVELGFVALDDIALGGRPQAMGLILCNDYTDRETLLRHIDVRDPTSGNGFATGKSFPGYLPVGEFLVVPRDFRAFARDVELTLSVNGIERQRAFVNAAVWDADRILEETFARRTMSWEYRGESVSLLGGAQTIPARTVLLSGTPHGTVFQGIGLRYRLAGVASWIFGGWGRSLPDNVIDSYTRHAHATRAYLQPGDVVIAQGTGLGRIQNRIVTATEPRQAEEAQ